jgi:hypothetical protein
MSDKVTVRFMTASAIVINVLGWCVPAHAQNQYDTTRTVTVEGEVATFGVSGSSALFHLFPIGQPKSSETALRVDWVASSPLSDQGITQDWLKTGGRPELHLPAGWL